MGANVRGRFSTYGGVQAGGGRNVYHMEQRCGAAGTQINIA